MTADDMIDNATTQPGDTVALKIRSIREGAAYTVEDNRRGTPSFRRWRKPGERSGAALPSACDSNRPSLPVTIQKTDQ
jgi:hypothetical protein